MKGLKNLKKWLAIFLSINIMIGCSVVNIEYPRSLDRHVFKNTEWHDLLPCSNFLNEREEFLKTVRCSNVIYHRSPLPEHYPLPKCFVVTKQSKDVKRLYLDYMDNVNYIYIPYTKSMIVGYFDNTNDIIILVENHNIDKIYRHELQHYILKLQEGYGGGHHQDIWDLCESSEYSVY